MKLELSCVPGGPLSWAMECLMQMDSQLDHDIWVSFPSLLRLYHMSDLNATL